jgi:hypothetical protein
MFKIRALCLSDWTANKEVDKGEKQQGPQGWILFR